jgi:hypothetical protein
VSESDSARLHEPVIDTENLSAEEPVIEKILSARKIYLALVSWWNLLSILKMWALAENSESADEDVQAIGKNEGEIE